MTAGADAGRRTWPWLLALLLAALALRLFRLGAQPFWVDELFTWRQLHPGPGHSFWEQVRDTVQGTLYVVAAWPWRHAAPAEWWLRFPAALAGVAAVPAAWRLGRLLDRATGWWLAVLVAVNPFSVWYSQEARGYTVMILCGSLATLAWWRAARRGITLRRATAYAGLAWLTGLGSMAGYLLVAAQAVAILFLARPRDRREWGLWGAAYAAVALLALPWLLQALGFWYPGRLAPGGGDLPPAGQEAFSWLAVPYAWFSFVYGFSLGPSLAELHRPDRLRLVMHEAPLLAAAVLPLLPLAWAGWRRFPARERAWWAVQVVLPVLGLVALRELDVKTFTPRYLAATLPLVLWLPAAGLAAGRTRGTRWAGRLFLALTFLSLVQYHGAARYRRDDMRAAARWIARSPHDGDPVLVPGSVAPFRFYYRGRGELRDFWNTPPVRDAATARRLLAERIGEASGAWLVLCRWRERDPRGLLERTLRETGDIDEERRFPGVRVLHWRRAGAETGEESPRGPGGS